MLANNGNDESENISSLLRDEAGWCDWPSVHGDRRGQRCSSKSLTRTVARPVTLLTQMNNMNAGESIKILESDTCTSVSFSWETSELS